MKSFNEWLKEAREDKFETMYDVELFIQGKSSPKGFKDTKAFLDKFNNLPEEFNKGYEEGRFDTLIFKGMPKVRVGVDYVRRLVKLFYVNDDETQDTLYKQYSFQELIKV